MTGFYLHVSQILAWNGGGSSNYTQIIKEGGYGVKGAVDMVNDIEDFVTAELKELFSELKEVAA